VVVSFRQVSTLPTPFFFSPAEITEMALPLSTLEGGCQLPPTPDIFSHAKSVVFYPSQLPLEVTSLSQILSTRASSRSFFGPLRLSTFAPNRPSFHIDSRAGEEFFLPFLSFIAGAEWYPTHWKNFFCVPNAHDPAPFLSTSYCTGEFLFPLCRFSPPLIAF